MKRWRLVAFFVALQALPAYACEQRGAVLLQQISERVQKHRRWTAPFSQRNHIRVLKAPLVSTGRVEVDAESGVVWLIEKPIASRMEVGPQGLTVDGEALRSTQLVAALLRALISGELGVLEQTFEVSGCSDSPRWTADLTPRSAAMQQRITRLALAGSDHVELLTIHQPGGNRLEIELQAPQPLADAG